MVQAGAGSCLAAHLSSYPGLDGCPGRFIPVYPSAFIKRFLCDVQYFLKIGAHSSLMLLFCQFALFSLSSFFMYLVIFSFCEVCGISFLASCAMGRSDVAPAFASRSAISLPS